MIRQFAVISDMFRGFLSPNKKATTLRFPEIDLSVSIPLFLRILTEKQIITRAKKRSKKIDLSSMRIITNNPECKPLFMAVNAEFNLMTGMMITLKNRTEIEAGNEHHEFVQAMLNSTRDISKNYSKIFVEQSATSIKIDEICFERTEILQRTPERALSRRYYYEGFHNGFQILFSASYRDEKRGAEMVKSIEAAVFQKETD